MFPKLFQRWEDTYLGLEIKRKETFGGCSVCALFFRALVFCQTFFYQGTKISVFGSCHGAPCALISMIPYTFYLILICFFHLHGSELSCLFLHEASGAQCSVSTEESPLPWFLLIQSLSTYHRECRILMSKEKSKFWMTCYLTWFWINGKKRFNNSDS